MRILSTVCRDYYGFSGSVEPMYLAFTLPLRQRGHQVVHFDHARVCDELGPARCGEQFLDAVRKGGYDLVLYQSGGRDHMVRDAIGEAKKYAPIVAWNSDDDWQWESYSRHLAPFFTYVVTTYPHILEQHRGDCPNLLLSQWGALDLYADHGRKKDIDFSFAGQIYRNRVPELRRLWLKAGLNVHGLGSIRVWCPPFNDRSFRNRAAKWFPALNRPLKLEQVYDIWNRTKVSYTPMSASTNPKLLQIKGRAFEMGLSWTMMLCQQSPNIERYYEPGKEFVAFDSMEDCIQKARYYVRHDAERQKIVEAYYHRTRGEHMWEHRWEQIFKDIGVNAPVARKVA
jgi:spore maturation protein CgeB